MPTTRNPKAKDAFLYTPIRKSTEPSVVHPRLTQCENDASGPLISFFIPDLSLGGAEQVTVTIVNGLTELGHNVELLVSRFKGRLRSKLANEVTVIELKPSRTPVLGVAANIPALISYLRRMDPEVLFSHMSHVSVVCLAINRFVDINTMIIPTEHKAVGSAPGSTIKSRTVQALMPYLYPTADHIVAVSEGVANSVVDQTATAPNKVSVLPNPVDLETIRDRAEDTVDDDWLVDDQLEVILFVGRLEAQKSLETWLNTFKRVYKDNPNVRGIIAGSGSKREELQSTANHLGIENVVRFPGYIDNPYAYMSKASIFLLTSIYEGLPTVIIEALACGCPVVATDCPSGPREILENGEFGRLAPVGDVEHLAEAVTVTLDNPQPSKKLHQRADRYSPTTVIQEYESFLEDEVFIS